MAILAAGILSRAMSSDFEYLYSLRVIAALVVFARDPERLATVDWKQQLASARGGCVLVFFIWVVTAHFLLPASGIPEKLAAMPPALRGFWIMGRLVGGILVVPMAEELAYRGYLMRRLMNADFESVPYASIGWPSLVATALAFGLTHGALWLPGIASGLAFGLLLVRRGRLGETVAAHASANALIAMTVLARWSVAIVVGVCMSHLTYSPETANQFAVLQTGVAHWRRCRLTSMRPLPVTVL